MLTTLAGRDTVYVERDKAFSSRDAAVVDRDAHRAYVDEVTGQAGYVLAGQDSTVRMTMTLLELIDNVEQQFQPHRLRRSLATLAFWPA